MRKKQLPAVVGLFGVDGHLGSVRFHPKAGEVGCKFAAGVVVGVEAGPEKWSKVIVAQVAAYKSLQKSVGHAEVKVSE